LRLPKLNKILTMENYIFFHRNGECRKAKADPSRPDTWPFAKDKIREVHQDCTEMFLLTPCSPRQSGEGSGVRIESVNLQKLLDCISDRYKEKLTLDFALSLMGMSKSRFCAFFRTGIGMSYIAYINKERIKKAIPLLLETNQTVEAIGFDCGFDSPSHFYKCFKEQCGVSPAKFRVEQRQTEC